VCCVGEAAPPDDCTRYGIAPPSQPAGDSTGPTPSSASLFRSAISDVDLSAFRNILVVKLDNIGDAVLLSPFLRELRANTRDSRITLMIRHHVHNLVALCPYVDRVVGISVDACSNSFDCDNREFAEAYGDKSFDLAIVPRWDTDEFGASGIARRSGARRIVGFSEGVNAQKARRNAGFDQNYSDALLKVTADHAVVQNLALLRFMNGRVQSDTLEAWIGSDDEHRAEMFMQPIADCDHVVAVCPGATHPGKIFPAELLSRILARLPESYRFVLLGDGKDRSAAQLIRDRFGDRALPLCGETTLREASAILQRCRAAIAMDSALVHLAAAVARPIVLFSMQPRDGGNDTLEQSPLRFGPWCAAEHKLIIQPEHAWPGCETGCRFRDSRPHCIANIDVEAVGVAARAFLASHVEELHPRLHA